MDVVSTCPLRVASRVCNPALEAPALLVVCKATYRLIPGASLLADQQDEPNEEDNHWDDDPGKSVYSPCDLIPQKHRADVVLVGHAFAPKGAPVGSIVTRLVVGSVDKSIEAFTDRFFTHTGELRHGPRVARVSLRYERAAGGPGTTNPVGMRGDVRDSLGAVALPNLQPPGLHITRPGDRIEPIGYGPIAPSWPTRAAKIGPQMGIWSPGEWHEAPLPPGIDIAFFNVAPVDQQVDELRPDERIVLENMHPDHEHFVTNLPGVRPRALVERGAGTQEELELHADTLWIDTSRAVATMVWRGLLGLRHPAEQGRVAISLSAPGWMTARWSKIRGASASRTSADGGDPRADTVTIDTSSRGAKPVMPFEAAPEVAPRDVELETIPDSFASADGVTFTGAEAPSHDPLPFVTGASAMPAPPARSPAPAGSRAPSDGALPFVTTAPALVASAWSEGGAASAEPRIVKPELSEQTLAMPAKAGPTLSEQTLAMPAKTEPALVEQKLAMPAKAGPALAEETLAMPAKAGPAFVEQTLAMPAKVRPTPAEQALAMPAKTGPALTEQMLAMPAKAGPSLDVAALVDSPAPPPMIGPLAVPEPIDRGASVASGDDDDEPRSVPSVAAAPQGKPTLPAVSLERCATIAASIDRRPPEREQILERHELTPPVWAAAERDWKKAMRTEMRAGKTALLDAYDAAYVAQLEAERGPIQVKEYACLVVAEERGGAEDALAAMDLPRRAMPRIERVWLEKTARDESLEERVEEAIDEAREA